MKYTFAILFFIFPLLIGTACDSERPIPGAIIKGSIDETSDPMKTTITISDGDRKFTATLLDNASVTAFKGATEHSSLSQLYSIQYRKWNSELARGCNR